MDLVLPGRTELKEFLIHLHRGWPRVGDHECLAGLLVGAVLLIVGYDVAAERIDRLRGSQYAVEIREVMRGAEGSS